MSARGAMDREDEASFDRREEHARAIERRARELGFDAVAFARADEPLGEDFARYEDFLAAGYHGSMAYLASDAEVRRTLASDAILRGARSVVCVAVSYKRARAEEERDAGLSPLIARYARGADYHNWMRKKLRSLARFIRALDDGGREVGARPMCDDVPVLERAWAARSGLGFVGKNGLVIVPGVGSMLLLGEVVTTLALPYGQAIEHRCGECVRCLEACPTSAFVRPFVLDARRCIAYLTIELRGPLPDELRRPVGEHLFGCDDCQDVCPFNAHDRAGVSAARFQPHPRWAERTLEDLETLDDAGFEALREGSPLGRAGRAGLARNAAIVLENRAVASEEGAATGVPARRSVE